MSVSKLVGLAPNDWYKSNGVDARLFFGDEPSLTRQEFAEECDINSIMKRYEGHDIGSIMRRDVTPTYIDFSDVPDNLMDYLEMQKNAENAFMTLPAAVRREFDNNALEFVAFASDPGNLEQMRTWGLAPPAPPQPPEPAPVASPAPAAAAGGGAPPPAA